MESFSNESSELSELELDELIVTKFVGQKAQEKIQKTSSEEDDERIETARAVAVGSPMALSPIGNDDFLLDDYRRENQKVDNAVRLLIRIQNSSETELKNAREWDLFEMSKKKKNTSRVSELALIDYVIENFDHRPSLLHVFCRRLIESDIQGFIGKALLGGNAPSRYRSVFRMTIKTDMPMRQLLGQLQKLWTTSNQTIEIRDVSVTACQRNLDGTNKKYRTTEMVKFAELEHKLLLPQFSQMSAAAHFPITAIGRPFVTVNVDYRSELDQMGRRQKTIVIEQVVTPTVVPERRVTFGTPLIETIHEYDIDEVDPFHSLRFKIFDLIGYLESVGINSNNSFSNFTVR